MASVLKEHSVGTNDKVSIEKVELLLNRGASADATKRDDCSWTLLHHTAATRNGNRGVAVLLLNGHRSSTPPRLQ